jgi:hypothetical protein
MTTTYRYMDHTFAGTECKPIPAWRNAAGRSHVYPESAKMIVDLLTAHGDTAAVAEFCSTTGYQPGFSGMGYYPGDDNESYQIPKSWTCFVPLAKAGKIRPADGGITAKVARKVAQ